MQSTLTKYKRLANNKMDEVENSMRGSVIQRTKSIALITTSNGFVVSEEEALIYIKKILWVVSMSNH